MDNWKSFQWSSWRFAVLVFFIGAFIGVFGTLALYPRPQLAQESASQATKVDATLTGKKEFVYVEKVGDEKTDVQIDTSRPKVTVSVNGQEKQFQLATTEKQKFDKGKLVITEETQLKLDIKTPQPRFSIGVGWSTHGPALILGGRMSDGAANWWLYGDRRSIAGGVQIPLGR